MGEKKIMRRIFAASDLHAGAPYSAWQRDIGRIEAGIRAADCAVLCGDMFEGTMMHMPLKARIALGRQVLTRLANANPDSTLHVLFGNHELPLIVGGTPDKAPYLEVAQAIREAARGLPNVQLHEKGWLQLGDIVFTHGHREIGMVEPEPNRLTQTLHLLPNIALPGYSAATWIYPTRQTVQKLYDAFAKEKLDGPVNHIVFGHTHAPLQAYTLKGQKLGGNDVQFHNLGAAIAYRPGIFQPLMFEQDEGGITQSVRRPGPQADVSAGRR